MITLENFSKSFGRGTANEVQALSEVNLTIGSGEFVTVIGANGSGKSTLLNAIAGSFFGDTGSILIDNNDVTRQPNFKRAKYIGRVFQNPYSGTAPSMTIAENLQLAALRDKPKTLRFGLSSKQKAYLKERVAELEMGLEDRLDTPIGLLSGGQRQALTLLMATLNEPSILLLDEHTAALDPKSTAQILYITNLVIKKYKLTTLMITHSMEQAATLGNRIIIMSFGKIAFDIPSEDKRDITEKDLLGKLASLIFT
ncbi:MAG: ATP-binding cassette domain-containing protein [Chloroherpetonaceae bacterium]|nr:ATP-binding cassette domain-containing protein [Chloroherpetonaceae bacterium]